MAESSKNAAAKRRRKWRKPKDKPKPPMTAYNLFFQREMMMHQRSLTNKEIKELVNGKKCKTTSNDDDVVVEDDDGNNHNNNNNNNNNNLENIKPHIDAKWSSLDVATKSQYEMEAKIDQERYAKAIEEWQNQKFQLGSIGMVEDDHHQHNLVSVMSATGVRNRHCFPSAAAGAAAASEHDVTVVQGGDDNNNKGFLQQHAANNNMMMRGSGLQIHHTNWQHNIYGRNTAHLFPLQRPLQHQTVLEGLEPTPIASLLISSHQMDDVGSVASPPDFSTTRMVNNRHQRSVAELTERYLRSESLSQLVSQLEKEEVDFLASLRHA